MIQIPRNKNVASKFSLSVVPFSFVVLLAMASLPVTDATFLHSLSNVSLAVEASTERSKTFVIDAILIPVIVLLSGTMAGLTLGYMSLDGTQLEVLSKTGTAKQRIQATRILPILKNRHLLLVTLLLSNMILNETLPIIAEGVLGSGIVSVVVSTALVIIFGEIIPQSICTTYGLVIGSTMVYPVQILIWAFFIIAWPVAWLLNRILGPHSGIVYRRQELKELINLHGSELARGGDLDRDTITIVGSALDFQIKTAGAAMTPIDKVFMLPIDTSLDYETLGRILQSGHSRIPVYETTEKGAKRVISVLLTKQLLLVDPEDGISLGLIPMNPLPIVPEDLPLPELLNSFQIGKSHMAIVCRRRPGFSPSPSSSTGLEDVEEKDEPTSPREMIRSLFKRRKSDDQKAYEALEEARAKSGEVLNEKNQQEREKEWLEARTSRSSLSALYLDDDHPIGLITLEDLIEEILGEEIYDEFDIERESVFSKPSVKHYVPPEAMARMASLSGQELATKPIKSKPNSFKPPSTPPPVSTVGLSKRLKGIGRSRSSPGRARAVPVEEPEKGSSVSFAPVVQVREVFPSLPPAISGSLSTLAPITTTSLPRISETELAARGRKRGTTPTPGTKIFKSPPTGLLPIRVAGEGSKIAEEAKEEAKEVEEVSVKKEEEAEKKKEEKISDEELK